MKITENLNKKRTKQGIIALCVFVIIITIIVLLCVFVRRTKARAESDRIECPGFTGKSSCKAVGCLYENVFVGPKCYMDKGSFGYKVQSVSTTDWGATLLLNRESTKTPYGDSFKTVRFEVKYITENIVRFKLTDDATKRYEVPVQQYFPLLKKVYTPQEQNLVYNVSFTKLTDHFTFKIARKGGDTLWDTNIGGLVMSDQFLQIASYLPSSNVYGLGENVHETLRHDMDFKTWPLFSRDRPPVGGQTNLYGVHPFYTCLENNQKSHGVLLLNSNAMEVSLMPAPAISFRTIGGVLDFFMFVGDSPEHVIQLYTSLIGRPVMPPYWALGFQLSRYGYNSLENVKNAITRTREANISQEVQFLDIDHFDGNKDFTYDSGRFEGLPEYIQETKEKYGLKWIIILDPAIAAASNYQPYEGGKAAKVFIERSPNWPPNMFPENVRSDIAVYGWVWPSEVVAFPDFFKNEAKQWWIDNIVKFHETIEFDGLWIDMNEPSSFETNSDHPFYCDWQPRPKECWSLKCPTSSFDDPPYNPLKSSGSSRLSQATLCMDSAHRLNSSTSYSHYDVHSLYGWSETLPTLLAGEQATGTRSLVISRSTYPSSGQFCGHWLGDNKSIWPDLRRSVIGMLEFNLFGIPYIGADVCGFFGDTTPELCKRWMQLGAFYPFFRNHNAMGQKEQDPANLGPEVLTASQTAVERRIHLNPYLYTLFYRAHVDGSTVIRPLFHEFPQDEVTWDIGEQFMWGKSILVTPVLKEGAKSVSVYLPKDEWWYFQYAKSYKESVSGGVLEKTDVESYIPMHVRGGTILPLGVNMPLDEEAESSYGGKSRIQLYVFPKKGKAFGELFADDGISKGTLEKNNYQLFSFEYENCSLTISKRVNYFDATTMESLVVFGAGSVTRVYSGEKTLAFNLDVENKVLFATVNVALSDIVTIKWSNVDGKCDMS